MSAFLSQDEERVSGKAADTGSAVHMAAKGFHKTKDLRLAVGLMREMLEQYPLADLDDAEEQFQHYARDPRNKEAEVIQVEWPVEFTLDPAPEDPTQEKIHVIGVLDQVREDRGVLCVCDIKTGASMDGYQMLSYHATQLAAYQLGASIKLGRPVERAAIIRTKDYLGSRKGPVFWETPWSYRDLRLILSGVAPAVARVRAGLLAPHPGDACRYCPQGGVANCVPRLRSLSLVQTPMHRP